MRQLKRKGFADKRLAQVLGCDELDVQTHRHALGIRPVYKRVDTCAAEFRFLYRLYVFDLRGRMRIAA
jgi:carbamoyl-phosphate synthase large subunit